MYINGNPGKDEILEKCPDEFRDELEEWLGNLEALAVDLVDNLYIECAYDLKNIVTASDLAQELRDLLY